MIARQQQHEESRSWWENNGNMKTYQCIYLYIFNRCIFKIIQNNSKFNIFRSKWSFPETTKSHATRPKGKLPPHWSSPPAAALHNEPRSGPVEAVVPVWLTLKWYLYPYLSIRAAPCNIQNVVCMYVNVHTLSLPSKWWTNMTDFSTF